MRAKLRRGGVPIRCVSLILLPPDTTLQPRNHGSLFGKDGRWLLAGATMRQPCALVDRGQEAATRQGRQALCVSRSRAHCRQQGWVRASNAVQRRPPITVVQSVRKSLSPSHSVLHSSCLAVSSLLSSSWLLLLLPLSCLRQTLQQPDGNLPLLFHALLPHARVRGGGTRRGGGRKCRFARRLSRPPHGRDPPQVAHGRVLGGRPPGVVSLRSHL